VNLDGAVAIVTGGGGAMGNSMVQALAAAGTTVLGGSGYTSSKAGLIRMTQTLALEVGSRPSTHGIRGEGRDVRV
jgi:NAD(P)-dependent dehydrogenase (short-subunit alcohol dehydrogenase family)